MPVKLPPPTTKTKGPGSVYDAYIKAHPTMGPYKDLIWKWSHRYGLDATYFAAMLWTESFAEAKKRNVSPETIMSPSGAGLGIGQINPIHVGEYVEWLGRKLTRDDLKNPDVNVRWSADYFAQGKKKYGTYDATYKNWYNSGYTGNAFSTVPKGYSPQSTGFTPEENAGNAAEDAGAKQVLNDPWAVLTAKGQIRFVKGSEPPKNALKYGPEPLTQSRFIQKWKEPGGYGDHFFSYTGRQASGKEIAGILKSGISTYALDNMLVLRPGFVKSPTYKAHAPGLIAIGRDMLGNNWKPSGGIIRKAIAQNWDQATFEAHLMERPEYLAGPAFRDKAAKNANVFQTIYGHAPADDGTKKLVEEVTLQGWTPDVFAQFLREQPAYQQSPEFQSKALAFGQALGLVTASMGPTLKDVPATVQRNVGPNSTRIPGQGGIAGNGLGLSNAA